MNLNPHKASRIWYLADLTLASEKQCVRKQWVIVVASDNITGAETEVLTGVEREIFPGLNPSHLSQRFNPSHYICDNRICHGIRHWQTSVFIVVCDLFHLLVSFISRTM